MAHAGHPDPHVDGRIGALMGRTGRALNDDGVWKADKLDINHGGYDAGGTYWGLRLTEKILYAVHDGTGNIVFVHAVGPASALLEADA